MFGKIGSTQNKTYAFLTFAFLCVTVQYTVIHAKRILIISNIAQYSHQITYRGLVLELNRRGHEVMWVTPNPVKNSSLTNYKEIDLNYFYKGFLEYNKEMLAKYSNLHLMCLESSYDEIETLLWRIIHIMNRNVFENSEMQKLYAVDSGEHFDAVIVAQGPTTSMNAFAYRFNAPLIGKKYLSRSSIIYN